MVWIFATSNLPDNWSKPFFSQGSVAIGLKIVKVTVSMPQKSRNKGYKVSLQKIILKGITYGYKIYFKKDFSSFAVNFYD